MPTGISALNIHVSVPELPQPSSSGHTADHCYSTLEHLAASLFLQFDVCSLDQPFRYRGWKPRNKCRKQVAKLDYSRHREETGLSKHWHQTPNRSRSRQMAGRRATRKTCTGMPGDGSRSTLSLLGRLWMLFLRTLLISLQELREKLHVTWIF